MNGREGDGVQRETDCLDEVIEGLRAQLRGVEQLEADAREGEERLRARAARSARLKGRAERAHDSVLAVGEARAALQERLGELERVAVGQSSAEEA